MILRKSLTIMWCIVLEVVVGDPLVLEIFRPTIGEDVQLYHALWVDGQKQTVVIDTGCETSFFVWRTWLEAAGGRCSKLFCGCYDIQLPYPEDKDIQYLIFPFSSVGVFPHSGQVKFGTFLSTSTTFGLVCAFSATREQPFAVFGLAPGQSPDKLPTFMEQLMSDPLQPLSSKVFALYLKPDNSDLPTQYKGSLLLGGGDPSVYDPPLRYIPVIDIKTSGWQVRIGFFEVEGGDRTNLEGQEAEIDSGTNTLWIPKRHRKKIISAIREKASEAAGRTVNFLPYVEGLYAFNCDFLKFMPTLRLGLGSEGGEVTIAISNEGYFLAKDGMLCLLGILFMDTDNWMIPDTALVGNYFEFDENNERIGYARLKEGAT